MVASATGAAAPKPIESASEVARTLKATTIAITATTFSKLRPRPFICMTLSALLRGLPGRARRALLAGELRDDRLRAAHECEAARDTDRDLRGTLQELDHFSPLQLEFSRAFA